MIDENIAFFNFTKNMVAMLDMTVGIGMGRTDARYFCYAIREAGPGDYVEVGTAHGGSAILAALTKRIYQIPGDIYCIDNFSQNARWLKGTSPERVFENAASFGVDDMIHVCPKDSHPWPLGDRKFVMGYIDGYHHGTMPARDFLNMSKHVSRFIMLDDVVIKYKNILDLCADIQRRGEWELASLSGRHALFKRLK